MLLHLQIHRKGEASGRQPGRLYTPFHLQVPRHATGAYQPSRSIYVYPWWMLWAVTPERRRRPSRNGLTENGFRFSPWRPRPVRQPGMRSGQPLRSTAISNMTAVRCIMTVARSPGWPFESVSTSAIHLSNKTLDSRSAAFAGRPGAGGVSFLERDRDLRHVWDRSSRLRRPPFSASMAGGNAEL